MAKKKNDLIRTATEKTEIERTIKVGEITSQLVVKATHNTKKNTWNVTSKITTTQVDPTNPDVTEATLEQVKQMQAQLVEYCIQRSVELSAHSDDAIKFPAASGN